MRAATSSAGVRPAANSSALATTIAVQTSMQRLGPKRSIATPSGSCTTAKAKKNALDSTPTFNQVQAVSQIVHNRDICLDGLACTGDRHLAEYFTVAIDSDGSRARLKEYDERHTGPFGQQIDCKKELDYCRARLRQYDERHARDLLGLE